MYPFRGGTVQRREEQSDRNVCAAVEPLSDLSSTVLAFLMSPRGFALNRYSLQILKATPEMGGVYCVERGGDQHAQPSLVSAPPRCRV